MSFLGGPECSTAGNPLSQFTKHVQDDNSLQRDRLANRGPNGSLGGFRSGGASAQQDEVRIISPPSSGVHRSPGSCLFMTNVSILLARR